MMQAARSTVNDSSMTRLLVLNSKLPLTPIAYAHFTNANTNVL